MQVLGFAGSLRRHSHNRALLEAAARLFPDDVGFDLSLHITALPPYDEDLDRGEPPVAAARLRTDIATADALLFATPEYNSSIPGGLKNALDWASRPYETNVLRDKPVAVLGASTGLFGAVWAQADLRRILRTCGAHVLDRQLTVGRASEAFTANGALADPALAESLDEIVAELLGLVQRTASSAGRGHAEARMRTVA
jgi:chromate reductase